MAAANGVATSVFQELQSPSPNLYRHGCAQCPGIMMQAHTLKLHGLTVEKEPFLGIEFEAANSEARVVLVNQGVRLSSPTSALGKYWDARATKVPAAES